jgi:hypothetical protein
MRKLLALAGLVSQNLENKMAVTKESCLALYLGWMRLLRVVGVIH